LTDWWLKIDGCPRNFVLTYHATLPLSTRSPTHLAELLHAHRACRGTRNWRLGRQALLGLTYLRDGNTPARLATGRRQPTPAPALHP
jgi:hypothetical protein